MLLLLVLSKWIGLQPNLLNCVPLFSAAPKYIKMFVLDEADEMLSRGFKDQIYEIFQKLSTNIQVCALTRKQNVTQE